MTITYQRLPKRQGETLVHAALGHCIKETAREMGITAETVKSNRSALMSKLHAHNTTQAVAEAFRQGYLNYHAMIALCIFASLLCLLPLDDSAAVRTGRQRQKTRRRSEFAALDIPPLDANTDRTRDHVLVWDDGLYVAYL